jgi:hypothetical protein
MATKPTAEICQVWIKSDGRVIKAMRLGRVIEDFMGQKLLDVTKMMAEEGWFETGRWIVANTTDETLVTFQRERATD